MTTRARTETAGAAPDHAVVGRAGFREGVAAAGPLAAAGLLANAGSLVVTVVLARVLAPSGYGALNQLVGVFFVVATPGSAVVVAVVRRLASRDPARDEPLARWTARVHRRAALALAAAAVGVTAAGPALAHLLGRTTPWGVAAAAMAGAVWVALCIDRGVLQAHRRYRPLATNLLVEGCLRTVLMVVFGAAGLGAAGVAVGVLVAELGTAAHARHLASRAVRAEAAPDGRPGARLRGLAGPDLWAAGVALCAVALLQYVDVLEMAREAPRAAGGYAAVSVATKALVFLALVVSAYLLPEAALSSREGTHALRQLGVALGLLAPAAAAVVLAALVVPRPLLASLFSARYTPAADAFFPLALAMTCLAALVVLTTYLLAVGDRRVAALLAAGALVAVVAVAAAGGDPRGTATADLGVQAALLVLALAELVRVHRSSSPVRRPGPVPAP